MEKLTKKEALDKIEELKKYVSDIEAEEAKTIRTIIYRVGGSVLWESDKETIKEALEEAVISEADLREANLSGANLFGAYLSGAELSNTKFFGRGGTVKLKKEQIPDFLEALGFIVEDWG